MTISREKYVGLDGHAWDLAKLDDQERGLLAQLRSRVHSERDWNAFDNFWLNEVTRLYAERGQSRKSVVEKALYRIGQDLSGRLAISLGLARVPDYRDQLREIIREHFDSRRAFCAASGLSEDMLSHVLAGRKHLGLDTLTQALARIGYQIQLVPNGDSKAS